MISGFGDGQDVAKRIPRTLRLALAKHRRLENHGTAVAVLVATRATRCPKRRWRGGF